MGESDRLESAVVSERLLLKTYHVTVPVRADVTNAHYIIDPVTTSLLQD